MPRSLHDPSKQRRRGTQRTRKVKDSPVERNSETENCDFSSIANEIFNESEIPLHNDIKKNRTVAAKKHY